MGVVAFDTRAEGPDGPGAEPAKTRGAAALLRRIAREPLTHFIVVGFLIFAATQTWRHLNAPHRIVITPAIAQDLATKYQMQFGTPPDRARLDQLVDSYIDEEVLYREGVAQGLDRGDEIVRRRIAQKAEFLLQDLSPPAEPSDAELQGWYRAHQASYSVPAQFTFSHLYFSPDRGGDAAAHGRAAAALAKLNAGAAPEAVDADPFPDLNTYADLSQEAASRVFGASELVARLPQAPVGRWAGPFHSAYGWHLIRVSATSPGSVKPFAAIRDQVRGDYLDAAQKQSNAKSFAALKARYQVVREDQRAGQ